MTTLPDLYDGDNPRPLDVGDGPPLPPVNAYEDDAREAATAPVVDLADFLPPGVRPQDRCDAEGEPEEAPMPLDDGDARCRSRVVTVGDVEPETVSWLWRDRVPRGKLTVLDGDPGLGKSTLMLDIAARVSRGAEMPDGTAGVGAGDVLILSAEDGAADTIRPRLDAAGAECGRVHLMIDVPAADGQRRPPAIPEDVDEIGRRVEERGALLVVVDPLMAYLGGTIDTRGDHDVRRALHPLAEMAERTGAAVVVVRHLNKSGGGHALYRGGGSIGIIGAARSGLLVGRDPRDEERRVLASTKANLAPPAPSLSWELEGTGTGVARVRWLGTSEHGADALVAPPEDAEARTERTEAGDWLIAHLEAEGGEAHAGAILRAGKAAGHAERTLRRARTERGVTAYKQDYRGGWVWGLPGPAAEVASDPPTT